MYVCNTPLLLLTRSHTVALFCAKRVREAADGFALHHEATSVQVTMIYSRPSNEKASLWNFYIRRRYCQHFPYASFRVYKAYRERSAIIHLSKHRLFSIEVLRDIKSFGDPLMCDIKYHYIILEIFLKFFEAQTRNRIFLFYFVKRTFISINACEELLRDFDCGRVDFELVVLEYAAQYTGSNSDSFASRHVDRWQLWWKSETKFASKCDIEAFISRTPERENARDNKARKLSLGRPAYICLWNSANKIFEKQKYHLGAANSLALTLTPLALPAVQTFARFRHETKLNWA